MAWYWIGCLFQENVTDQLSEQVTTREAITSKNKRIVIFHLDPFGLSFWVHFYISSHLQYSLLIE